MNTKITEFTAWMENENINAVVIEDREFLRNLNIFYLCNHPGDAVLFILSSGETVLVPWDKIIADKNADCTAVIPYSDFNRELDTVISKVLGKYGVKKGARIEISSATPFPAVAELKKQLPDYELVCRIDGFEKKLEQMRMIKTNEELSIYTSAGKLTDILINEIEENLKKDIIKSEIDVALLIERRLRELGAEECSFDTIAAGADRSFGIHAIPSYSGGTFPGNGISLLDFGLKFKGYCTDVTIGVTKGKLTEKQQEMTALVQKAYDTSKALCKPGMDTADITNSVIDLFKEKNHSLDHALGHGLGLIVHEKPVLRKKDGTALQENMIITLEPGLYDAEAGGIRLENDILITADGNKAITNSRIIHL